VSLHWLDQVQLGAYLLGMAATGAYFARRNTDTEEYFVGGRRFSGCLSRLTIWQQRGTPVE